MDSGSGSDGGGGTNGYIRMGDREETTVRREMGERRTGVVVTRLPSLPGPFPSWIKDEFEAYDRCRRGENKTPRSEFSLYISGCSVSSGRSWSWAQRLEDTLIGRGIDIYISSVSVLSANIQPPVLVDVASSRARNMARIRQTGRNSEKHWCPERRLNPTNLIESVIA